MNSKLKTHCSIESLTPKNPYFDPLYAKIGQETPEIEQKWF